MYKLSNDECTRIRLAGIAVDHMDPEKDWVVSLTYSSRPPTDEELAQLVSFRDYVVRHVYSPFTADKILAAPIPIDPEHSTHVFCKGRIYQVAPVDEIGWGYRRPHWNIGKVFEPSRAELGWQPPSLVAVLDMAANHASWEAWKADHPDVFPRVNA